MDKFDTWVPFLKDIGWTQFATFTTRKPITVKSARRIMEQVGFEILRPGQKMFWAAETFQLGVRSGYLTDDGKVHKASYHIHALIETRRSPSQVAKWYDEHFGRVQIKRYDKNKGAVGYVAKYITKQVHDYDLLIGMSWEDKKKTIESLKLWNSKPKICLDIDEKPCKFRKGLWKTHQESYKLRL